MRVHELAKELNIHSDELLESLQGLNFEVGSRLSGLTEEQIAAARAYFRIKAEQDKAAKEKAIAAASRKKAEATAKEPAPPAASRPPEPSPGKAETAVTKEEPDPEQTAETSEEDDHVLIIKPPIVVREFAEQLGLKPNQLIAELMGMNIFASINQKIEIKTAQLVAAKHGFTIEQERKKPVEKKPPPTPEEQLPKPVADKPGELKTRPPVVCFMGHVDHGKTSLMDRIRNTKVTASEAGGITQHIGAYTVTQGNGNQITFLDTPGHEAFTKMRARGANLTDIAVIVIDAVDGMMPQTKEAIQHARAAGVSIMIAINKIDLRAANIDRVKTQLQQDSLTPEDWGGETICCPVSAISGDGVDHLLEMISLQAEVLELKANPQRHAEGFIVEARMETGMGPTATLLVRNGTLKLGDIVLCGPHWGKVKALIDAGGNKVKQAGPSHAVKVLGLSGVPEAGAEFSVVENEKIAKEIHAQRQEELREKNLTAASPKKMSIESLFQQGAGEERKSLPLIIKSDVQGSLEAIQYLLDGIKSDKVGIKTVLTGIGNVSVNDILLAKASKALIIGFNVSKENGVTAAAKREGVEIRLYSIIYELADDLKVNLLNLLDPMVRENVHGQAIIKQVFDLGKKGKVAGCLVTSGRATSRSRARIKREGEIIHAGSVSNLKRYQNDANEVREGQECGIRLDNFSDFHEGDIIELYDVEKIAQQL
ncbi:MAG: translation initiation factor IF-2 [Verrucomicrobia bacterium]|nr:translation initiation factor IF-2 [Verrucomicrobiota bacterium]